MILKPLVSVLHQIHQALVCVEEELWSGPRNVGPEINQRSSTTDWRFRLPNSMSTHHDYTHESRILLQHLDLDEPNKEPFTVHVACRVQKNCKINSHRSQALPSRPR